MNFKQGEPTGAQSSESLFLVTYLVPALIMLSLTQAFTNPHEIYEWKGIPGGSSTCQIF